MEFTQADIDEMIRARRPNPESRTAELEKGIQRQTLNHIRAELRTSVGVYRTAEQIAAELIGSVSATPITTETRIPIRNG